jgi:hypothetical protein
MDTETLQRLRILALTEMGHSPWMDTSKFQKSEKTKLVSIIQGKYDMLTSEQIISEFNTLIIENILLPGNTIEKLPVQTL